MVDAGPGYWMHETSGRLWPAIAALVDGEELSAEHIATLRAYFRQWVCAAIWDENPYGGAAERDWLAEIRRRVDELTTRAAIEAWIDDLIKGGMDPL
jgi:hypothetical protein